MTETREASIREAVARALESEFEKEGRVFDDGQAETLADAVLAALGLQEGGPHVVLPREPTEAMLNGARDWSARVNGRGGGNEQATGCYRAMLAAQEAMP